MKKKCAVALQEMVVILDDLTGKVKVERPAFMKVVSVISVVQG